MPITTRRAEIFSRIAEQGRPNYLHLDQNAPSLRRWLQPRAYWVSARILYRHVRTSTMPNMFGCIRDRKEVTACYLPS